MYISAKIMRLHVRDYVTYPARCRLRILPVIFIIFDWVKNALSSVICVAVSIIFLAGIFIFQGEKIKTELNRRMHI
jgi:hypothetical protein